MEYCLSVKFHNDNYGILSLRGVKRRSNPQPLLISSFIKNKKNSLLTINIKTEKKKILWMNNCTLYWDCHEPSVLAMTVGVEYPGVPYRDYYRPLAFIMRNFGCV